MIKRIFLVLLVLGLVTLTVPPLRQRAQPSLDRFRTFLGQTLEGPLSPVMNPYRRLRSQAEIEKVVRELISDRNIGVYRPQPDSFQVYVQRAVEDEDGLDAWGTPYIMVPEPDSMSIVSAGPDLTFDTDDDVVVKIRYARPPSRFRR